MSTPIIVWLSLGVFLILLEMVIPGGVVSFLGLAALVIAGLMYFGFVTEIIYAIISWFIISIIMVLFLRTVFMKFFPGNETIQNTDEDEESFGSVVEVVERVTPYQEGRIRFRETTWVVQSDFEIDSGEKAIIEKRNGNKWVIKPI